MLLQRRNFSGTLSTGRNRLHHMLIAFVADVHRFAKHIYLVRFEDVITTLGARFVLIQIDVVCLAFV